MNDLAMVDEMPLISAYTADDGVADGTLIDLNPPTDILPIKQIGTMDSYLKNYGAILGKKAIHALAPLHVPFRDELPDFSDCLREPFPAQAHVVAAAVKMLDKVGSGFIVGEMGCIAGESEVYDPVAGLYRRVDQITEPFHVVSHHEGISVVGKAHVPFIKGTRDLYRVTLSDGQTFVATDHHRILTDRGYQPVSEVSARLQESGFVPLPSIAEPCPSGSPRDAGRSSRTPSGSLGGCRTDRHSHDGQPRSTSGAVPEPLPRRADALGRTQRCSQPDALASEGARSRACQSSALHSMTRFESPAGRTSLSAASGLCVSSEPYGQDGGLSQADPRSLGASFRPRTTGSSPLLASQSAYPSSASGEFESEKVHVTSIVFTRTDRFYDFTVDEFHNYVMAGVVHHNTGKTLLGMLAAHKHAQRSRKQGGSGGLYRAIVLCPDHLIGKWVREIEETIPEALVCRFGPQGGEVDEKPKRRKKGAAKPDSNTKATLRDVVGLFSFKAGNRWSKPKGAEFFVLGRNQAKWLSDWSGMADLKSPGFRGIRGALTEIATTALIGRDEDGNLLTETTHHVPMPKPVVLPPYCLSSKTVVIEKIPVLDEFGRPSYNKFARPVMQNVTGRVHICPSCGQTVVDKKGVPLAAKDLQKKGEKSTAKVCPGAYLQMLPAEPDKKTYALDRIPVPSQHAAAVARAKAAPKVIQEVNHAGHKWVVKLCKAPLYNYTSKPYRWSPALIIKNKCRKMFKYLIIDEVHEQKSDESAQSMACGKLIGASDHVLALTGTIIGGYANHLYPLLMRIAPKSLRAEGFTWDKPSAFDEAYGRIDRIVTIKEQDDSPGAIRGNVKSMRRAKSGSRTERKAVRPGVMPTMFGRHMIGSCMFITLDEMSSELPDLFEYVGGPVGPAPVASDFHDEADFNDAVTRHDQVKDGWFEMACDMEPRQRDEYKRVMATLEFANKELLRKGSMKLLGTYLWTGMDYPDKPYGWGHDRDMLKDLRAAHKKTGDIDEAMAKLKLVHTVGFWDKPGVRTVDNFVGIVTPKDCPEDMIYPKERALIDLCVKQKQDGRQTWVYVQMTGKRNVQPRLAKMLEAAGLKVGILRSDDVEPIDREEWIAKHGRDFDVMISHPQLVSTGLDLFSKRQGGHNYSTLVFYETGYNLFTMRQAARRAWRIGQPLDCRVYYLYYKDTMQHKAMTLMSKKMAAAQALEGEFSEEGLAAMAGEDNLQMALAKNLSERIDDSDMQRSWGKVKSGPKKVKRPTAAVAEMTAHGSRPSPLDNLPIELQIVSESLIEAQGKPVPVDALAGFGELAATLRDLDAGFDALSANEEFAAHEADIEDEADDEEDGADSTAVIMTVVGEQEFDTDFDEEYVPDPVDDDDDDMVMSEEILARMFANMMAHGLTVG